MPRITTVAELDSLINIGGGLVSPNALSPEMLQLLNGYARGTLAMQEGDLETAINIFHRLLALAPSFIAPRVNLGNCLVDLGDPEQGLQELKRASQSAPRDVDVYMSMSKAYAYLFDSDLTFGQNSRLSYFGIAGILPKNHAIPNFSSNWARHRAISVA